MTDKAEIGRKARKKGVSFENVVRQDLSSKGYITTRWTNNVFDGKLAPAKHNYFFPSANTGFPDILAYKPSETPIGVECKLGKYLDAIEKTKIIWYITNSIFEDIYVAYKKEGQIHYISQRQALNIPSTAIKDTTKKGEVWDDKGNRIRPTRL